MAVVQNYLPGDPLLIDKIVCELKSQGIFDQFRKECIADVDTKPAYQNLRQRVEGSVSGFLNKQTWNPDMNKNYVRELLRKNIYESGFLETGVERIVDQVVNPKINSVFLPKVTDIVYKFLGIQIPNANRNKSDYAHMLNNNLLPTDLEAVSPEFETPEKRNNKSTNSQSLDDSKLEEDESPPFEPIEEQTTYLPNEENSVDSHLSGFSGLLSHDSNQSQEINKPMQFDTSNQDSVISKHSTEGHLSIAMSDDNEMKMEYSEDSYQSKCSKTNDSSSEIFNFNLDNSSKSSSSKPERKSDHKVDEKSKSDKAKSHDKHKSKHSRHHSKSESKDDKDRKTDYNKKDVKEKHSFKSQDKRKSSGDYKSGGRSSSKTDRDSKSDVDRESKMENKTDKEKGKNCNGSQHRSSSSKDKSSSRKESTSKERDHSSSSSKEKSRPSSSRGHKDSKSKEDKTKTHTRHESKSDKHKSAHSHHSRSDRHSSSSKNKDKDKKDSKKEKKENKDDHFSSKKQSDRRSTDRDSNDGQSGLKSSSSSFDSYLSSQTQSKNQESSNSNSNTRSGESGASDTLEHEIVNLKTPVTFVNEEIETIGEIYIKTEVEACMPRIKLIKPKFASNIHEARKLMKIRKQLTKIEQQNVLELAEALNNKETCLVQKHSSVFAQENNRNYKNEKANTKKEKSKKKLMENNLKLVTPLKVETSNDNIAEAIEELSPPLKSSVISAASWDALEAKFNQNIDYSTYYDAPDSPEKIELTGNDGQNNCMYFDESILPATEHYFKYITALLNKLEKEVHSSGHEKTSNDNNFTQRVTENDPPKNNGENSHNAVTKKSLKRKLIEYSDAKNNNKKFSNHHIEVHENFSLPLSPAESDNSVDKKSYISELAEKPLKKNDIELSIKLKKNSITLAKTQRYSSEDLYKPRPLFRGSRRRMRNNLELE